MFMELFKGQNGVNCEGCNCVLKILLSGRVGDKFWFVGRGMYDSMVALIVVCGGVRGYGGAWLRCVVECAMLR